jgi:hypothetical protein
MSDPAPMYSCSAFQPVSKAQPSDVVSNIFYSINARRAIEQQREQQRQFEQSQRTKIIAYQQSHLAPSSKVFVPKTEIPLVTRNLP